MLVPLVLRAVLVQQALLAQLVKLARWELLANLEAKGQLEWISLRTGLKSHQQLFYGETFDSFKLMESLYSLEVEEDDVIFFYYSGHGFRTRETLGALPVMEFYDDQGRMLRRANLFAEIEDRAAAA